MLQGKQEWMALREEMMEIYYLLLEAKPCISNEERKEAAGAYINCWIKAEDEAAAKDKAVEYIAAQGWEMISMEEIRTAQRERYAAIPESLACYEQAIDYGVGMIFYIWSTDDKHHIGESDCK